MANQRKLQKEIRRMKMEEEKKPQSSEELTDGELDAISGGFIVVDIMEMGKTIVPLYTAYDNKGNPVGDKNDQKIPSKVVAQGIAKRNNVSIKCISRSMYDYYLKYKKFPAWYVPGE